MAAWRRRALALFPQLRRDLNARDYTVYSLFFDLNPLLRDAFDANDNQQIGHVFEFAEWCARQTAQPLWNAAGVAFYEHLFDHLMYSDRVLPWLSPLMVYTHWDLWVARVDGDEWTRVAPLLEAKRSAGERDARRPTSES